MKIYIDTNFLISLIIETEFSEKAKRITEEILVKEDLFTGINVVEESLFVLFKLTKKPLKTLTKYLTNLIKGLEIEVINLLPYEEFIEVCNNYELLPNDTLIAATCKFYNINKIATFDEDFKKVDFLEIVEL